MLLFGVLCWRWFLSNTVDTTPMTRSDYLDLSLSLLEAILAVITIFLAGVAFFAYFDIRRAAERMAEQTTLSVIQRLSNGERVFVGSVELTLAQRETGAKSQESPAPDPAALGQGVTKTAEGEV